MLFTDFEKAFDTVERWVTVNAIKICRIDHRCVFLIKDLYKKYENNHAKHILIKRGIRQGNTIYTKQFLNCLKDVFKTLNWRNTSINITGKYLSNLRFADDIVSVIR